MRRAATIFDRVVVAIAANPGKAPLFSVEERVDLARRVLADIPGVEVQSYAGLTVDFARFFRPSNEYSRSSWGRPCSSTQPA